jgi:hypothetical protein
LIQRRTTDEEIRNRIGRRRNKNKGVLLDSHGALLASAEGESSNIQAVGEEQLERVFSGLIHQLKETSGVERERSPIFMPDWLARVDRQIAHGSARSWKSCPMFSIIPSIPMRWVPWLGPFMAGQGSSSFPEPAPSVSERKRMAKLSAVEAGAICWETKEAVIIWASKPLSQRSKISTDAVNPPVCDKGLSTFFDSSASN